jgi:hypothetical protein
MKKTFVISLLMIFCANIFAKKAEKISQIVESKDFRINILNVYHEKSTPIQVYSSHYLEIKDGKIVADFPYFVRNDKPNSLTTNNVALNSELIKYKAKHNKKKGYWQINLTAVSKQDKEYQIIIVVQPNGYSTISVTSPNKTKTLYDGQLKIK